MSAMLGRTWSLLTAAVSTDSSSNIKWTPPRQLTEPGIDLPRGLAAFLRSLLSEPDSNRIIQENIDLVKAKFEEPGVGDASIADGLLRMIVADLHGFDVSFAAVHALKLAQKANSLSLKKIGYLTSTALLKDPSDPLNLLLVNTILKDLSSKNLMEINFALIASSSHLLPDEVIPLLLPSLNSKTSHIKDFIRKKALASLHGLLNRRPDLAADIETSARRCLMDSSPGVLSVALQLSTGLVGRVELFDIFPGILDISDQILDDKLPQDFNYKGLSAPWMLIDVLRLSSLILSEEGFKLNDRDIRRFAALLKRILSKSSKELIAQALTFECIRGMNALPDKELKRQLISSALPAVSKFLQGKSSNMKYSGIASLELLFKDSDLLLTPEQEGIVSDCLSYPDETIRRKTLSLLYVLAHEKNVRQICDTLIQYIKETDDKYKRKEFLEKASDLTHKFQKSQGLDWYINVLLRLSQVSPSEMKQRFLQRIKSVLSSSSSPSTPEQAKVGSKLQNLLSRFLFEEGLKTSKSMTSLYIWVWSHFDPRFEDFPSLIKAARKADSEEALMEALFYIFTQKTSLPEQAVTYIVSLASSEESVNERIADKAKELGFLINLLENECLPSSSQKDFTLSYLDEYILEVSKDRELSPYRTKSCLLHDDEAAASISPEMGEQASGLRLTPYNELPFPSPKASPTHNAKKGLSMMETPPVWTSSGISYKEEQGGESAHPMFNKRSDSLESFFVEDKHITQNTGLESLSKDDFALSSPEEED